MHTIWPQLRQLFARAMVGFMRVWIFILSGSARAEAANVAEREMLKRWRLEHMSVQDDPPQPMITD